MEELADEQIAKSHTRTHKIWRSLLIIVMVYVCVWGLAALTLHNQREQYQRDLYLQNTVADNAITVYYTVSNANTALHADTTAKEPDVLDCETQSSIKACSRNAPSTVTNVPLISTMLYDMVQFHKADSKLYDMTLSHMYYIDSVGSKFNQSYFLSNNE